MSKIYRFPEIHFLALSLHIHINTCLNFLEKILKKHMRFPLSLCKHKSLRLQLLLPSKNASFFHTMNKYCNINNIKIVKLIRNQSVSVYVHKLQKIDTVCSSQCPTWGSTCKLSLCFDTFIYTRTRAHVKVRHRKISGPLLTCFPNTLSFNKHKSRCFSSQLRHVTRGTSLSGLVTEGEREARVGGIHYNYTLTSIPTVATTPQLQTVTENWHTRLINWERD